MAMLVVSSKPAAMILLQPCRPLMTVKPPHDQQQLLCNASSSSIVDCSVFVSVNDILKLALQFHIKMTILIII